MGKIASRRPLLLCFNWARAAFAATVGSCLICVLLLAGAVHALDPNKRITQYVHTAWRYSDHTAPDPMYAIGQTSDGFLWFVSADMYRFDGVRFVQRGVPGGGMSFEDPTNVFGQILNVYGDHAGGLWVLGVHGIVRLKDGVVTSHFDLEGIGNGKIIEDPDGSVWVTRGSPKVSDSPLCHITERGIKCFGKADGIPIAPLNSILPDGKGGFWLGGQTTLVHWHSGVSETYPIEALKSNVGQTGIVWHGTRSRWIFLVGHIRGRAGARARTIHERYLPTVRDARLRRQQTRSIQHRLRPRRKSLGRRPRATGSFVSMETS